MRILPIRFEVTAAHGRVLVGLWWQCLGGVVAAGAVVGACSGSPSQQSELPAADLPADRFETDYPSNAGFGRAHPPAGTFVDLSAGAFHTCGVRTGGELLCWGADYIAIPGGRFVRVDTWESGVVRNMCAVAVDASAVCTSKNVLDPERSNEFGQADAPEGDFVDVSVAERFSCGLRTDGSAQCWGDNGSVPQDEWVPRDRWPDGALDVPEGPFVEVHAGHPPCALRPSGEFVCWSDHAYESLSSHSAVDRRLAIWDERLARASPGWGINYWRGPVEREPIEYVCGIRPDSTLVCTACCREDPPEGEFLQVDHTAGPPCALRADQSIVCWNPSGAPEFDVLADPPEGEFTQIAVGAYHACAIRVGGTVACWGENSDKPLERHCAPDAPCPD